MKNPTCYYIALLVLLLPACNSGGSDPVKDAKKENKEMIDSQVAARQVDPTNQGILPSKEDADFMVNAASVGMLEVQLGQLAQTHAGDTRVKNFAAMMVRDHKEGGDKLKTLAASKNILLPDSVSKQQQKEKERLQKKKGDAFDQAYINMMVDGHKKNISAFEKEAGGGTNPAIKTFASEHLRMLYIHLDSATSIQKMIVNKMPAVPDIPATLK
jgi:putative membrane protein